MKTVIVNVLRELSGLFIDDGLFALAISAVVALTALITPVTPLGAGLTLVAGCLGVLVANTATAGAAAGKRPPP
ncbi:MAG: hypothetical protein JWQ07_2114 [Ramlibacter sp.]|nr:hypothetical protein [Ramlibacter sp.]